MGVLSSQYVYNIPYFQSYVKRKMAEALGGDLERASAWRAGIVALSYFKQPSIAYISLFCSRVKGLSELFCIKAAGGGSSEPWPCKFISPKTHVYSYLFI